MKVLVTGAHGFIGKNLVLRLHENTAIDVVSFVRGDSDEQLLTAVKTTDAIVHLAGENRPLSVASFEEVNVGLTRRLCDAIRQVEHIVPLILASSVQAELDNPYGRSKLAAEDVARNLAEINGNPIAIYRLPGVFGKWCKPDYNSVVATFCHNIANDLPIHINDPEREIPLVYVDDVIDSFLKWLQAPGTGIQYPFVNPNYRITLADLARQIDGFRNCRSTLVSERVGTGLVRALYATYVSYLPTEKFVYDLPVYGDARGLFVEMLKTLDCGQFSYFTALPGITRGGHYHHTKTEKFLVIKGVALFRFRHILTDKLVEFRTSGAKPQVVDTIPGWSHDITNVGSDEMVVMLWANENFDRQKPDTVASKV